ncbi:MAG: hypothetical protein AB1898_02320 [Acidobacteriota bacterium]
MLTKKVSVILGVCLATTSSVRAQERFGLRGVGDITLARGGVNAAAQSDRRSQLNGQFTLLGSVRLSRNLIGLYEGRVNRLDELTSPPRSQRTNVNGVLQAYLRYSPDGRPQFNLQVGKFGSPFGNFLTRNYANDNPLVGAPLIYAHRLPIRTDEVPDGAYDLVYARGRIQNSGLYNSAYRSTGWLPLIGLSYPTGAMFFGNAGRTDYRVALVNSSLSNSLNLGVPGQRPQWVAAGGMTLVPALRIGSSFAQGPYLDPVVRPRLPAGTRFSDFTQRALGFDLQWAFRHLEVHAELLFNNLKVPNVPQRLGATGYFLEMKQTWTPRFFTAVRWNQIYFDRIRRTTPYYGHPRYDYNVNSLELGLGWRFSENLLLKASSQFNRTLAPVDPNDNIVGAQLVYTFDLRTLLKIR